MDMIKWVISTIAAGVTLTVGAYSIFETKDVATDRQVQVEKYIDTKSTDIERRLQRIEDKIDRMRR